MAYENVNVESARSAINQCLSTLNHTTSSNIISELSSNANWDANSKETFKKALEKLVNTRYKELEDYLKKCLENINKIEQYKNVQAANASYDSQINSQSSSLHNMKISYNNMQDKTTSEARTLKNKIDSTQRTINDLNSKKSNNNNELQRIANSIDI